MTSLAAALSALHAAGTPSPLTALHLTSNSFGDAGVSALAAALRAGAAPALAELGLGLNYAVTDAAVKALAEAARVQGRLRSVDFAGLKQGAATEELTAALVNNSKARA